VARYRSTPFYGDYTMALRTTLFTVLTVAAVLALLYAIPAATGYQIECGNLERSICEEA